VALQHAELLIRHERAERALRRMRRNRLSWRGWVCGPFANHHSTASWRSRSSRYRETMHANHCEIFELSGDARVLVASRRGRLAFGSLGGAFV